MGVDCKIRYLVCEKIVLLASLASDALERDSV